VTTVFSFNSTSYDVDGGVVAFNWSFGDGTTSEEEMPEHTFPEDSTTYMVTLKVKDDMGMWSQGLSKTVTILNLPPVAVATPLDQVVTLGEYANFSAVGSTDPDDDVADLSFEWDFDDGSLKAKGVNVSHLYTEPGHYNVTLTVTDDDGDSSIITVTVKVEEADKPKPPPKPDDDGLGLAGLMAIILIIVIIIVVIVLVYLKMTKGKDTGPPPDQGAVQEEDVGQAPRTHEEAPLGDEGWEEGAAGGVVVQEKEDVAPEDDNGEGPLDEAEEKKEGKVHTHEGEIDSGDEGTENRP
jgi:PKD repeat protein